MGLKIDLEEAPFGSKVVMATGTAVKIDWGDNDGRWTAEATALYLPFAAPGTTFDAVFEEATLGITVYDTRHETLLITKVTSLAF